MPAVRGALRGSRSRGADSGRSARGSWGAGRGAECTGSAPSAERTSASGVGPGAHKLPQSDRFHAGGKGVNPFSPAFFMFACGGLKLPTNVQCGRFHARARAGGCSSPRELAGGRFSARTRGSSQLAAEPIRTQRFPASGRLQPASNAPLQPRGVYKNDDKL